MLSLKNRDQYDVWSFLSAIVTMCIVLVCMFIFDTHPLSLKSRGGQNASVFMALGFIVRGLSAGMVWDSEVDKDKAMGCSYMMLATGNLFFLLGFLTILYSILFVFILIPLFLLFALELFSYIKCFDMLFSYERWSSYLYWQQEWKVVILVSFMTILIQYIGFSNGVNAFSTLT